MSVESPANDAITLPDYKLDVMEEARPANRNNYNDSAEAAQSPEELVRTETRFVQYFRSATIALLIAEAVTAGLIIYRQATKQERQSFHNDFEQASSLIVQGFSEKMERLLWDSYTFGVAAKALIAASAQVAPNITVSGFDDLTRSPVLSSQVDRVVWSPYIASKDIFTLVGNSSSATQAAQGAPYFPVWQIAPFNHTENVMLYDQFSDPYRSQALKEMISTHMPVISEAFNGSQAFYDLVGEASNDTNVLRTAMYYPVVEEAGSLLGTVCFDFTWETLFESILPANSDDIVIVLENTQGQAFTFLCGGPISSISLMGEGDLHNSKYDGMVQETPFQLFDQFRQQAIGGSPTQNQNLGAYRIQVYPTETFEMQHGNNSLLSYTLAPVVFLFIFTTIVFLLYDCIVKRRQIKVMASAQASGAIVSSLFPAAVRDRLLASAQHDQEVSGDFTPPVESQKDDAKSTFLPRLIETPKNRLKRFLKSNPASSGPMTIRSDEEPIADLFHNTTVLFADIAGFTAWSSEREPPQVFKLLETLYSAFDNVANTLGVFKVETIGDCYVAVTGLPERQADHAVRMAKFASAIILKMQDLTKTLESSLGPSTANLSIRVGLHSGPVTAGVLRGQKARFQLFGDTINTASRMESTGQVNKIQISQMTADLLAQAGHSGWLTPRQELLSVKGKGEMQTYWINSAITMPIGRAMRRTSSVKSVADSVSESADAWGKLTFHDNAIPFKIPGKTRLDRLVDWNTDLLFNYLSQIIAKRLAEEGPRFAKFKGKKFEIKGNVSRELELTVGNGFPIDEITDAVTMPPTTSATIKKLLDKELVDLSTVRAQLRHYVARVASMYRSNPFHCFEHASHVVMSACKLLKRIVTPEDIDYEKNGIKALSEVIHQSTFGISSDPLLQFAVVFSALIHDVDHRGIPNAQLIQDRHEMAIKFNNKSIAEQHSLQVAWNLLMEDHYTDLRACIYGTETELGRFRQLLVNAVLATDIADQSQILIRKKRWEKAFHSSDDQGTIEDTERKASLVLEYIIQASDVAHTMQHWHVFIKWNERLFEERYMAYIEGRCAQDPSMCWYQDEIWFFDSYIIPLAKKLSECGVFGVSSEEYLTYALENRREWEEKGKKWVAQMVGAQAKAA